MIEVLFIKDWLKKQEGVHVWSANALIIFPQAVNITPFRVGYERIHGETIILDSTPKKR